MQESRILPALSWGGRSRFLRTLALIAVFAIALPATPAPMAARQPGAAAQTTSHIQIEGPQARRLVSLLTSGSEVMWKQLASAGRLVIRDLVVMKESTFKYDATDPRHEVDRYVASGIIGDATDTATITEATSLYAFFTELGLVAGVSAQGWDHSLDRVVCTIDARLPPAAVQRYRCDLTPAR